MAPQPEASAAPNKPPEAHTPPTAPEAAPAAPSPLEQARTESSRLLRRYRRQLAPLAALGATAAAGVATAAATGAGVLAVVAATGAASFGLWAYARARAGRWARAYAAIGGTGATAWTLAAAVFGTGGVMQTVLWLGGSIVALPWWIKNSEATPDVTAENASRPPAPPVTATVEAPPDWREIRWGKHVKNSRLTSIEEMAYGWRGVSEQPRGEHWRSIAGQVSGITSAFDLEDGRVFVEALPGAPVYKCRVTLLTENPLLKVHHWPHPGLDVTAGTFPVGITGDGELLHYRLWQPGSGSSHGLVSGTTNAGKSSALDLVLAEAANSDRFVPVIIDGGDGASLPDWLDHVRYKATTVEEAVDLLDRLVAAMEYRNKLMKGMRWTDKNGNHRTGRKSLDPTPELPGLLVVVDEAHMLLLDPVWGEQIRRCLEKLTQMGRKAAIGVVLATQQPSVSQLGGSSVLRDMCKSGTVIALRTGDRISGGFVGSVDLPEPLHLLPKHWPDGSPTHGLGYVTTARPIRMRLLLVDDPYAQAADLETELDAGTTAAIAAARTAITQAVGGAVTATVAPSGPQADMRVVTGDAPERVRQAIEAGTPADPFALRNATGLPWRAVKNALRALQDRGGN